MIRILNVEPDDYSEAARKIYKALGLYHERILSRSELLNCINNYDVLITRLGFQIDKEMLNAAPKLKFIITPTTGLNHIDLTYAEKQNIQVLSLKCKYDFLSEIRATAELTIGLALSLIRYIPSAVQSTKRGEWTRDCFRGNELYQKTAGIVGMGRLGKIVANYLKAFGMKIIGYDPRPDFPLDVAERIHSLNDLLSKSDLITLHVQYDDSTRHLIGKNEFKQMKSGAVLINTSRGGVIEESCLLNALISGRLAGAALDVLDSEPLITEQNPLILYARKHDNLLIVPHIGGNTYESFSKTELFMANQLKDAIQLKGE